MRVTARYDYVDEGGVLLSQVLRWESENGRKRFSQRRPDGNGGWISNLDGVRRVLYQLPDVLQAIVAGTWIYLVEGEKDVETLRRLGKVATTCMGGSGQWDASYTETLRGARVILIGDADMAGAARALRVASELDGAVVELRIYSPRPGAGKDVSEILDGCETAREAKERLAKDLRRFELREPPARSETPVDAEIRVMSMEELMATPDIDEHDKLLDYLLLRRSRFILGAYTGEGKSSAVLQMLRSILLGEKFLGYQGIGNGTRALVIDVEQGRRTVKRRFIEARLHEFPNQVQLIWQPDGLALDSNTRHIAAIERILSRGLDGKPWDVVIADPLYKLHQGNPNEERKAVDMMRLLDRWREAFGFALILPMHCRKPQAGMKFSIHDISGSGAYTHGAEVVAGLQRVKNGYAFLHWWKDREGDLGCIGERWGLIHDENGFHRDPQDLEQQPLRDRLRLALEGVPGMTINELREELDAKQATLRRALEDVGAVHDGARLVAERHWQMPPTLFDEKSGERSGS